MGAASELDMLDLHGDVRADAWPVWIRLQAKAHGWIGRRGGVNTEAVALDTGFAERTVERWLAGSLTPDLGVRRAIQRAWAAPAEAEAMRCLAGALRALQGSTEHRAGGGAGKREGPAVVALTPAPAPPPAPSPPDRKALLAALLKSRKIPAD